jgi:hypothetical protein
MLYYALIPGGGELDRFLMKEYSSNKSEMQCKLLEPDPVNTGVGMGS